MRTYHYLYHSSPFFFFFYGLEKKIKKKRRRKWPSQPIAMSLNQLYLDDFIFFFFFFVLLKLLSPWAWNSMGKRRNYPRNLSACNTWRRELIDCIKDVRMQRLNILSEVADRSAPRHYHCSSQILRRRGEDRIMMFYVLNAVNMTSLVVNSIVLLALVKCGKSGLARPTIFFALFSCLLGSIVCIDTQKITMRYF